MTEQADEFPNARSPHSRQPSSGANSTGGTPIFLPSWASSHCAMASSSPMRIFAALTQVSEGLTMSTSYTPSRSSRTQSRSLCGGVLRDSAEQGSQVDLQRLAHGRRPPDQPFRMPDVAFSTAARCEHHAFVDIDQPHLVDA